MTDIEKMRCWLQCFPGFDRLREFRVDLTHRKGENGGLFPGGLQELQRKTDICGGVTVRNRYVFGLYFVLEDTGADNAQWLLELQNWIQEQSILGNGPVFGDRTVRITAGKGALKDAQEDGVGLYAAEITVDWERQFG